MTCSKVLRDVRITNLPGFKHAHFYTLCFNDQLLSYFGQREEQEVEQTGCPIDDARGLFEKVIAKLK
jgi:hypothetical protein